MAEIKSNAEQLAMEAAYDSRGLIGKGPEYKMGWLDGRDWGLASQPPADDGALGRMREALRSLGVGAWTTSMYCGQLVINTNTQVPNGQQAIATLRAALSPDPDQDGRDAREPINCTRCGDPITDGYMIGDGDGFGRRFAHPECYREYPGAYKNRQPLPPLPGADRAGDGEEGA